MKGNHPKRRKDKYNPYSIFESDGKYYIEFADGQSRWTEERALHGNQQRTV